MPGPYHDFLLLSRREHRFSDYSRFINDPRAIVLEDDLLCYMADSLKWIPTHNPAKNEPHQGLCFYDRDDLVRKLRRIVEYAEQIVDTDGEFFILHQGI